MRYLSYLAIAFVLNSCSQGISPHGIVFTESEFKTLPKLNRASIEQKFGKPQYTSSFDPKKVYYLGYKSERHYIVPSEVIDRSAVEIIYDQKGNVVSTKNIALEPKNISPTSEKVPNPEMDTDWLSMFDIGSSDGAKI